MVVQRNLLKLEKNKTVAEVTKFWRNTIMMGESYSGKIVKAALKKKLDLISK